MSWGGWGEGARPTLPPPTSTRPARHTPTPPPSHSSVSPLAALEYSPADSVDSTLPPRRHMADSNDSRVRVDGS